MFYCKICGKKQISNKFSHFSGSKGRNPTKSHIAGTGTNEGLDKIRVGVREGGNEIRVGVEGYEIRVKVGNSLLVSGSFLFSIIKL